MPLILHAAWLRADPEIPDGQLFFWAENQDTASPVPESSTRSRAEPAQAALRQRAAKVPSHPLQTPASQLRTLLVEQMPALAYADLLPTSASVWTPALAGAPVLHRTALSGPQDRHGAGMETVELAPFQVTGLALPPLAALSVLSQLNNGSGEKSSATATIYHRLRLGKDLLFWSHVAKFALELLINQHYLPAIHSSSNGHLVASWQPFVSEERLQNRFDHLVQMMPPVCLSYNVTNPAEAPTAGPMVEHFVAAVTDAAVRTWGRSLAPLPSEAPAQRWLGQLLNGQRQLSLAPQQAYALYQQWQSWTEQLQYATETTFRVALRLTEPDTDSGDRADSLWTLHFLLQARDNPDRWVSARDVWQAQGGSLRIGNRRVDQPQERLRAGLNAAGRVFDPIARSLKSMNPESATLTTDEAYRFLREAGPILESAGFGVILPDWWHSDRRAGLGLRLRLATGRATDGDFDGERRSKGAPDWVESSWELTLAGNVLGRSEFEQMAAMRTPLLRLDKRWIELDPQQVDAAQRFTIDRQPTGILSLLEAVRVVQGYRQGSEEARPSPAELGFALPEGLPTLLPVDEIDVEGWLGEVIAQLQSQQPSAIDEEPAGFVGTLRPYQKRGVAWLEYLRRLGLGACLADDMGLGKTVQAIALLLTVQAQARAREENGEPPTHQPSLLICPTSVVANWRREVERFAPGLRVLVHHGSARLADEAFAQAVSEHDLVITSFGTARRDIAMLNRWHWGELILDEAQNIKNPIAKQTQAVRSLSARNRIALTGTPVENRLSELWSIVEFLNPGYLDNHERFRQSYIIPIERYNDDGRAADLRRLVQPFLLRRVKSDPTIISDLPEKNEMIVYCPLTEEQASLYEQMVQNTLDQLDRSDGIQRRGIVLGLLTKLKQITNHPAHFLKEPGPLQHRSGKLERLTEMLDEALAVGDHALVFTQFVEMGHLLQNHLREVFGVEVLFLHGGTPANQRDQMVQAFQEDGGPPIFVLSLRAGGAGLNLTRANHVFHFDRWWNPAVENQATDRAFRIGQRRNVQVHKFVVAGSLEERIHAIVEGKQNLADTIVGSGEQWLTELSTDQLRDLLTLRREMLEEM